MEECIEEKQRQSVHSPGIVRDEERLARFVWRSEHLAEDGNLAPAAFPVQDFLEHRRGGLSVARLDHMTPVELRRQMGILVTRTNAKKSKGMAVAEKRAVRAIRNKSGARVFCVIDAGLPDFQAHAATRLADHESMNRSSMRRVRKQLMRSFAFQPNG